MKFKKIFALLAPAILLASCQPSKTTTINKIVLSNAKTLVMGKLASSTNTDEEEDLISINEDGTVSETEVEVTSGNTTTETSDIKISRLVKLNNKYAVVSCIYNDTIYDLIVDLTDGTCVKFPDSSLLPNSKEKLNGHKQYRKYFKKYSYLNNNIIEGEENVFYYINYSQVALQDEEVTNIRRLVRLDLSNISTPKASALITPENNYSVQSFAVNDSGQVVYFTSEYADLDKGSSFNGPYYYADANNHKLDVIFSNATFEPFLYSGVDGIIYGYIKMNDSNKYNMVSIEYKDGAVSVTKIEGDLQETPKKILDIETSSGNSISTIGISNKPSNSISRLFTFERASKDYRFMASRHGDNHYGRDQGGPNDKTQIDVSQGQTALNSIIDGYNGNKFGYFFGLIEGKGNRLKRVQYNKSGETITYTYVDEILSTYFANTNNEVSELITDGETDDVTVIVEDSTGDTAAVVEVDESGVENEVVEIDTATEIVDVNNTDE